MNRRWKGHFSFGILTWNRPAQHPSRPKSSLLAALLCPCALCAPTPLSLPGSSVPNGLSVLGPPPAPAYIGDGLCSAVPYPGVPAPAAGCDPSAKLLRLGIDPSLLPADRKVPPGAAVCGNAPPMLPKAAEGSAAPPAAPEGKCVW